MREIELTQGKVAFVDNEDFKWLSQWKWCVSKGNKAFYGMRREQRNGRSKNIKMQNAILEHYGGQPIPEGYTIDHIDGDGLNNQKSNFRLATHDQQQQNRGLQGNNTSGYIGVSLHKKTQKHRARIEVGGKEIHLGLFDDPIEAAHVRDAAAIEQYGEFAKLN